MPILVVGWIKVISCRHCKHRCPEIDMIRTPLDVVGISNSLLPSWDSWFLSQMLAYQARRSWTKTRMSEMTIQTRHRRPEPQDLRSPGYDPIFKLDSAENKSSDARRLDIYRFVIFSLSRVRKSELFIQWFNFWIVGMKWQMRQHIEGKQSISLPMIT